MRSTTVVTICGRSNYFLDILKVASRYSSMGCIVLVKFDMPTGQIPVNIETLNEAHLHKIKISDIVHIVHFEDVDETTMSEIYHARSLRKAVTYVVPSAEYISSFNFKEDDIIQGPLKWVKTQLGLQVVDVHNKIVSVEREAVTQ